MARRFIKFVQLICHRSLAQAFRKKRARLSTKSLFMGTWIGVDNNFYFSIRTTLGVCMIVLRSLFKSLCVSVTNLRMRRQESPLAALGDRIIFIFIREN